MIRLALLALVLVLTACGQRGENDPTTAAAPPLGSWIFPAAIDIHYPVLHLRADGTFDFFEDAEWAGPEPGDNGGTWSQDGEQVVLSYDYALCCRFDSIDTEPLVFLEHDDDTARVRFREAEWTLHRP